MRNAISALSVLVVVALMAVSFAAGLVAGSRPTPAPSLTATPTVRPTRAPTPSPIPGITAQAIVVPRRSAEIPAPITAAVEEVFVEAEEQVGAGQLLLRLDPTTRRAALEVAAADLARAQAALERAQTALDQLPDDATIAQRDAAAADVRLAEAELELARSALSAAQAALRQTEIRAPFSGTVAVLDVGAGEQAVAGQTVITLADMGAWYIETIDLSELEVVRIAAGDRALITFEALPGVELAGVVDRISVRGTNQAGGVRFDVLVRPLSHRPDLRWNMSASVRILPDD
ncbi:MAG TPA: efflux RND transporter periplasmic adaptor subunit [Candidatus Limnocylindrales bacterium]